MKKYLYFITILLTLIWTSFDSSDIKAFAVDASTAPQANSIEVVNQAGLADIIYLDNLSPGDTVRIYKVATGGKAIAQKNVPLNAEEVVINVAQLGSAAGSIYVSVVTPGLAESARCKVSYIAEPKTVAPRVDNIFIDNNSGKADVITISDLNEGDSVKIYSTATVRMPAATGRVAANKSELSINMQQLGINAGSIYVSVTSLGMKESSRTKVEFVEETRSETLSKENMLVTNNAGKSDTIFITNLNPGDLIKVYTAATGGRLLSSALVPTSKYDVVVSIPQLGVSEGSVYISLTSANMLEGSKLKVDYSKEEKTSAPLASAIEVNNNAAAQDTILVNNLDGLDVVRVYDSATLGKQLGSAAAASNSTQAVVSISQLGIGAGNLYISVTSAGKMESSRTLVAYNAEMKSAALNVNDIKVLNNASVPDKVTVSSLVTGDIIKVYSASTGDYLLGSGTVGAESNEVAVPIKQVGVNAGSVYVTVKKYGKSESDRTKVDFIAEPTPLIAANVTVTNNVSTSDTVKVTGLSYSDIIKVYDDPVAGNLIGISKVVANSTETTVTIPQLGKSIGSIYVSVTYSGMCESVRTKIEYSGELLSNAVFIGNVDIINNKGSADQITISNLAANDVVKVYSLEKDGTMLGLAKVAANGTQVMLTVPQLGASGGSVYITVTSIDKLESIRVKVEFVSEVQ